MPKTIKWAVFIVFILLLLLYGYNDPALVSFFPKCPLVTYTGIKCAGCGSQRAVHDLINFNFIEAIQHNFLLVASIPYILFGVYLDTINNTSEKWLWWRQNVYGNKAILVVFFIIIIFWISRNIYNF